MDAWTALTERIDELDTLAGVASVIGWDEQTCMPLAAAETRGKQSALLSKLQHARATAPEVGEWLGVLSSQDLAEVPRVAVKRALRAYQRGTLLPEKLVGDLAIARSEGFNAWVKAKAEDDYSGFGGPLQRIIDLQREMASLLAPVSSSAGTATAHPYDALLEEYDPGSTVAELRPMFSRLGAELNVLLDAVADRPHPVGKVPSLDVEGQRKLSDRLLLDLGFDLNAGRLDLAAHPFTAGLGQGDVRLTTRLQADDFMSTLGSTVHECGHGLYEQGLPASLAGTGLNRAAGMGIHESQSRLWENFIGRSLPFFRYLQPRMAGIWPTLNLPSGELYGAANRIQRSLVRVSSDEATYNLHIIARFDLELLIFEGKLEAKDLPEAWNDTYRRIVGVVSPNLRDGVLQDVHWSSGYFGYFPSYTIGNVYAASLGATLEAAMPDLWDRVERGDFSPILAWLRTHIHTRGHMEDAPQIFKDAVGERDPVEDLMAHLWGRQGVLYGVSRT
ncbi:MAG: carboxypeptidase M32 [Myxococcales bacterium]|nr:carboxypeptidase M32 [Myxococcales bacterium]